MRNPIRLKNLSARFLPFYLIGVLLLVFFPVKLSGFMAASPLIVLGLLIRSWGAGHLVKNDSLTMTGPYAHLRHPLYAGTILVATGFAILFGGILAIAAIWPWFGLRYFPRKDRVESARLESLYGNVYASYRDAVPALWPRWTRWTPASERSASASEAMGTEPMAAGQWALERYSDNNELGTVIAVLGGMILIALRAVLAGG